MKVLVIWPPSIPSYFNAGHHSCVFSVASYLRKNSLHEVTCLDAGCLNYSWKELGDILFQNQFDVIAVAADFDAVDCLDRFIRYSRELIDSVKIIIFGRLSKQVPKYFEKLNVDAVHFHGDYEKGVCDYLEYLSDTRKRPAGVSCKENGEWLPAQEGEFLPAGEWCFPDISEIPYESYDFMYKVDSNRFCGLPSMRELLVPIARGCPMGCKFCDVCYMQGKVERRVRVDDVLKYIENSYKQRHFDYVSFYAPTFTLNRSWVVDFAQKVISRRLDIKWKCATTIYHLDESLLKLMAQSGCIRVSVGIETLSSDKNEMLSQVKRNSEKKLVEVTRWCLENNIELNCFVIAGLPGESVVETNATIDKLKALKVRVRPTVYTPYGLIDDSMTVSDIQKFNRQLLVDSEDQEKQRKHCIYKIIFGKK